MKKILIELNLIIALFVCQITFAASGSLFNVTPTGGILTINTTIPNRTYTNAGIKITTAGNSIISGCTPNANGYCLFSVSDTTPAVILTNVTTASMETILCLNGVGPVSCQRYTLPIITGIAYITNAHGNTVSICPVQGDGTLGTCTTSNGNNTFSLPLMVALNPVAPFAYITNFDNSTVSICPINNDGSFGTCTTSNGNGTFDAPTGVAIDVDGGFAYIANWNSNTISICPINLDGSFGVCTTSIAGGTLSAPQGITLQDVGVITYAYIPNNNSLVSICVVNDLDGSLSMCTTSNGGGAFDFPQGVSFNAAGTIIYIGDFTANSLAICVVNSDGTFGSCTTTTGNGTFDFSNDQIIGLLMSNANNFGYIPNNGNNTLSICPINSNGSLGTCVTSNGNGTFDQPSSIAISGLGIF